ncbi:hypothetical protein ABZ863_13085 [Saccharomonospora sp. NPDC046836]
MADFFAVILAKIAANLIESLVMRIANALFPGGSRTEAAIA